MRVIVSAYGKQDLHSEQLSYKCPFGVQLALNRRTTYIILSTKKE